MSAAVGFFCWGLKDEFEKAVVNELSVLEPLQIYCTVYFCSVFQCDKDFENATASEDCSLNENTTCEFSCNNGFMASNLTANMSLTCTEEGWIGQESLCKGTPRRAFGAAKMTSYRRRCDVITSHRR